LGFLIGKSEALKFPSFINYVCPTTCGLCDGIQNKANLIKKKPSGTDTLETAEEGGEEEGTGYSLLKR